MNGRAGTNGGRRWGTGQPWRWQAPSRPSSGTSDGDRHGPATWLAASTGGVCRGADHSCGTAPESHRTSRHPCRAGTITGVGGPSLQLEEARAGPGSRRRGGRCDPSGPSEAEVFLHKDVGNASGLEFPIDDQQLVHPAAYPARLKRTSTFECPLSPWGGHQDGTERSDGPWAAKFTRSAGEPPSRGEVCIYGQGAISRLSRADARERARRRHGCCASYCRSPVGRRTSRHVVRKSCSWCNPQPSAHPHWNSRRNQTAGSSPMVYRPAEPTLANSSTKE
jgi:hypothetical protein